MQDWRGEKIEVGTKVFYAAISNDTIQEGVVVEVDDSINTAPRVRIERTATQDPPWNGVVKATRWHHLHRVVAIPGQ